MLDPANYFGKKHKSSSMTELSFHFQHILSTQKEIYVGVYSKLKAKELVEGNQACIQLIELVC